MIDSDFFSVTILTRVHSCYFCLDILAILYAYLRTKNSLFIFFSISSSTESTQTTTCRLLKCMYTLFVISGRDIS